MSQQQPYKGHKGQRARKNSGGISQYNEGASLLMHLHDPTKSGGSGSYGQRKKKGNLQQLQLEVASPPKYNNPLLFRTDLHQLFSTIPVPVHPPPPPLSHNSHKTRRGGRGNSYKAHHNQNAELQNSPNNHMEQDDEEAARLNSAALRRIDKDFLKLNGTASQVAVYRYNAPTMSWDKTDTVGCLFLYERSIPPKYGVVVMNRKNTNNFIVWFGTDAQVVLQAPYLLLRIPEESMNEPNGAVGGEGKQVIHCIWFYESEDCLSSAEILRNMGLKFEGDGGDKERLSNNVSLASSMRCQFTDGGKISAKEGPKSEASMPKVLTAEELESQMLGEMEPVADPKSYDSRNKGMPYASLRTPPTVPPAMSVFDQFLNLSMKTSDDKGKLVEPPPGPSSTHQSTISHNLGSRNQMRTVEQLERDMNKEKSTKYDIEASTTSIQNELMQTLGIFGKSQDDNRPLAHNNIKSDRDILLDLVIGKSVDEVDPDHIRRLVQVIDPSNLVLVTEPVPGEIESRLIWKLNRHSSLRKETDSSFATPTRDVLSTNATRCSSQLQLGRVSDIKCASESSRQFQVKPTPLTKEQLRQTMLYLLQYDDDFIATLHNGYVQSLQRAFSPYKL